MVRIAQMGLEQGGSDKGMLRNTHIPEALR